MSEFVGVVTNAGLAKIAASIGGAALNLTTIRVGDGNGAEITPLPTMTDLVRRVGAAYPIISSGRDPLNAANWIVTALIPEEAGPFDIREIGVFDVTGAMIAIAKHPRVEKRTPAQGLAMDLTVDMIFPVSETAQIAITIAPEVAVSLQQMLRPGFLVVESATVTVPPAAPALGRTHVVPTGATGAWSALGGKLAQWNGSTWAAIDAPIGFVVVDQSKDRYAGNRWLERTAAGWEPGLTRVIQAGAPNWVGAFGGTANALVATLDPAPAPLRPGLTIAGLISISNTGASTLNLNAFGAIPIVYNADGSGLMRSEMRASEIAVLRYDGLVWRLVPSQTRQPSGRKNALINPGFAVSQRFGPAWTGDTLAAGVYGYDRWKAGTGGATIALAAGVLTISAGSIVQVVEAAGYPRGDMTLSWVGSAQARINGSAWSASPMTVTIADDVHITVEFGAGTVSRPQFEPGLFPTAFEQREFADEVNLCRRYCEIILHSQRFTSDAPNEVLRQVIPLVPKIAAPTITVGSAGALTNATAATAVGDVNYCMTLSLQATAAGICEVASRSLIVASEL